MMTMSDRQRMCLKALSSITAPHGEMCVPFRPIEDVTGLSRTHVKRSVRALARKGMAEFHKGLSTEGGEFAGAGYCVTRYGLECAAEIGSAP